MSKALKEVGWVKGVKFIYFELAMALFKLLIIPQARVVYLRLLGAKIGKDVTVLDIKFINCYRKGFGALEIADNCFIGSDCLLDLADAIRLEKNVTLASRINIVTHLNVGYKDHPLQSKFPPMTKGVVIRENVYVGIGSTILPGVTIGQGSFVAASSLVNKDVHRDTLVGGIPAKELRKL